MSKEEPAIEIEAELISSEIAEKIKKKIALKLQIKAIDVEIASAEQKIKDFMTKEKYKIIQTKGLRITHTPPRKFLALTNTKVAHKFLQEERPDLIQERSGYERLTYKVV